MSMYEEAKKLNEILKMEFTEKEPSHTLLRAILRFGQVAKYRCRSNVAYKNFVTAVFEDIATLNSKTIKSDGREHEVLELIPVPKDKSVTTQQ